MKHEEHLVTRERKNGANLPEEESTLLLGNSGSDYSDLGEFEFGDLLDADDFDKVLHSIVTN